MPRHVPASVSELSRIGLLVSLPGERLLALAERMSREDVASGTVIMREGEPGERFYVLLQGMVGVTQSHLGPRRLLRPGDYFGEVAAAMDIPRTATVTAITPCVVASCDRETFDEYVFPLFKEGQAADSAEDTAL
jgi:ATP-binding cassette, subfamily B, bacterial